MEDMGVGTVGCTTCTTVLGGMAMDRTMGWDMLDGVIRMAIWPGLTGEGGGAGEGEESNKVRSLPVALSMY